MEDENGKSREQLDAARERLKGGLGTSQYKMYGLAPYVHTTFASMPEDLWNNVFFSWLSLKGYLQGMHGLQRTEMFATNFEGRVHATFIVIWSHEEQLAAWIEHGYTTDEMLQAMGCQAQDIQVSLQRDFS